LLLLLLLLLVVVAPAVVVAVIAAVAALDVKGRLRLRARQPFLLHLGPRRNHEKKQPEMGCTGRM
jgi:hypothetical protein